MSDLQPSLPSLGMGGLDSLPDQAKCRLGVNNGLYRQPCHTSAYPPEADENDAKADMPAAMSAVEGRADVVCQGLSGPFIAKSGHSRFWSSIRRGQPSTRPPNRPQRLGSVAPWWVRFTRSAGQSPRTTRTRRRSRRAACPRSPDTPANCTSASPRPCP